MKNDNIVWADGAVTRERRQRMNRHRAVVLWFTGLSGSGKSTLSHAVEERLHERACRTFVLDGDNVRHGLCVDLAFSEQDRVENIRRAGEVSKLFLEAGSIVLTAFISPFKKDRARVRSILPHGDFIEVYCACSLATCEKRDVKGLYKKARDGEIKDFTGISSPYEIPLKPELTIDTDNLSLDQCAAKVIECLEQRNIIPRDVTANEVADIHIKSVPEK